MRCNHSCKSGSAGPNHRRRCEKIRLSLGCTDWSGTVFRKDASPVLLPAQHKHLSLPVSSSSWASWPAPRIRPRSLGKSGHSPGSFPAELMALPGSLPERHFASLQLIAIQSRQSSPQDLNAIFSLNYAKSFREGGEII